jgi:uncharacterized protein
LQIKVAELTKDKDKTFHFDFLMPLVDAEGFDLSVEEPARVLMQAVYRGRDKGILLEGCFDARVKPVCHRCLKEFPLHLQGDFSEEVLLDEEGTCISLEDEACTGEMIDLRALARQHLLLALPLKMLCREDCQGICPLCGQDRAEMPCECKDEIIDPRLEKLKELIKD